MVKHNAININSLCLLDYYTNRRVAAGMFFDDSGKHPEKYPFFEWSS